MMNYQSASQLKKLAKIIADAGAEKGQPLGLGEALDALAKAHGFQAWGAMAPAVSNHSVDRLLTPMERAHARDCQDDSHLPDECAIQVHTGFYLRAPAYPKDCEYVRVCDPLGREIAYWHFDEWAEDPMSVMGAVLGCLARGGSAPIPEKRASLNVYTLPFGVHVVVDGAAGRISSDLLSELTDEEDSAEERSLANGAADALESFLLALACEGVDLSDARIHKALESAVGSLVSQW